MIEWYEMWGITVGVGEEGGGVGLYIYVHVLIKISNIELYIHK
jgi:hypothetical protein